MYCDNELNQMWLQAEFLAVVNEVKPEVCGDLYSMAFGLYKEIACPEIWELIRYRLHGSELKALSGALDTWAVKWNLTEEWCKAAAYCTLQVWARSSKPGQFFWHPGVGKTIVRYDSLDPVTHRDPLHAHAGTCVPIVCQHSRTHRT